MPSVQASLFPFISSPTLLRQLEHELRRVTKLAPDLEPLGCETLQRDLSLFARAVDVEEYRIRQRVEASARRIGLLI